MKKGNAFDLIRFDWIPFTGQTLVEENGFFGNQAGKWVLLLRHW